jgi:hypothetical protein
MSHLRPRIEMRVVVWAILWVGMFSWTCESYRTGEAVGLLIRNSRGTVQESLRNQLPLFGLSSATVMEIDESNVDLLRRLSLSFEADGRRSLPWVDVLPGRNKQLETLTVTFVYSSPGGSNGEIHDVSAQTKYKEKGDDDLEFVINYVWIEQADIDINGGVVIMSLATLLVSCLILFQTCTEDSEDEDTVAPTQPYGGSSTSAVPKWD